MRENRYLRDKMIGRDQRSRDYNRNGYDGRNEYGSAGGYVSSRRDRNYDGRDYEGNDYARGRGDYYPEGRGRSDYSMGNDYANERESSDVYKKYERDLNRWMEKLKKFDKFKLSHEEIMNKARSIGVRFDDYSLEEFLAVYYMLMSDFPSVANDSGTYLQMAKKWLEDDDIEVSPSEKLCIYYYDIVKGECL